MNAESRAKEIDNEEKQRELEESSNSLQMRIQELTTLNANLMSQIEQL